jgi:mannose-6-phosphate isomerase-like protein (cupin superfamily)
MLPFKSKKHKYYEKRKFSKDTSDEELIWHVDKEDRLVYIKKSGGWRVQYDNQLPFFLSDNTYIFIPKGMWHRIIRGGDKLVINVYKQESKWKVK